MVFPVGEQQSFKLLLMVNIVLENVSTTTGHVFWALRLTVLLLGEGVCLTVKAQVGSQALLGSNSWLDTVTLWVSMDKSHCLAVSFSIYTIGTMSLPSGTEDVRTS